MMRGTMMKIVFSKDIATSNKNDNSDNNENNDANATKIGKGKRKATKEEEEAWEVEDRARNTEDNNNDDDEEDEDSYKKAQIQQDEQLAKILQSEEYEANTIKNYNYYSSYSVLSSDVNEDDTNERANKNWVLKN